MRGLSGGQVVVDIGTPDTAVNARHGVPGESHVRAASAPTSRLGNRQAEPVAKGRHLEADDDRGTGADVGETGSQQLSVPLVLGSTAMCGSNRNSLRLVMLVTAPMGQQEAPSQEI
jgi:hypothetical protein